MPRVKSKGGTRRSSVVARSQRQAKAFRLSRGLKRVLLFTSLFLALLWGGAWLTSGGAIGWAENNMANSFYRMTARNGFAVKDILVEGRQNADAEILLGPSGAIPIEAEADERAVMLVGGEASLDGQALNLYELVVLRPGTEPVLRSERGGRVMLMGGEAFATRRHAYWNFVGSSRERIEQAKQDWIAGRFPKVPGDEVEFIPFPERPLTRSED